MVTSNGATMGSLTALIHGVATGTPLRHLAEPVHDGLVDWQLRIARHFAPKPARIASQRVTAIIKSFERPQALRRLLESIRGVWPALKIVVADDSREGPNLPGIEVVRLPFDSGVSAGRQAALDRVGTELTWVLDDDFVMYAGSRLASAVEALDAYPRVDIVGGPVIDLPMLRVRRSDPRGIFPTDMRPLVALGTRFGPLEVRDKVPNFFIARTERLRLVGWTPELKRLDHADFFTRARGVLVTTLCDDFRCLHAQTPFDSDYRRHRERFEGDRHVLAERYGHRP